MREAVVWSKHRIFGGKTALVAGALHEHALPVDVPCREDMRHIALQVVVVMRILSLFRSRNMHLVKDNHTLNTGRSPEDQFKSLLWWIVSCDERTNSSRPAFDE